MSNETQEQKINEIQEFIRQKTVDMSTEEYCDLLRELVSDLSTQVDAIEEDIKDGNAMTDELFPPSEAELEQIIKALRAQLEDPALQDEWVRSIRNSYAGKNN